MEEPERLQKQKELVESIGRMHEKDGFQPVTARIMGLLMVMDKEEYTFDEIVQEMKISKSSASTALKNLEIRGVIEYVTYPGDRKRYFRFVSGDINEMIDGIEKKMKLQLDTIEQVLELKKNPDSRNAKFLRNVKEGIHFFIKNMRKLKTEYSKEH
ncbi:MarR family transcriptional regulator [Maribellus comscasis]|uniref:MarR family transcriptional regulator n=1 Tax=Maribellus comscasis TaxID=2681766 RepID=A0A6I6JVE5_9BACT|nr:MarR family transcriptional regulator [Maribellus comscasis]QGY46531.1 MarR family transcriptional regulator [Maribellus comscasis]